MTNGHCALHTWSHCPGCFSIIPASIPDAVGSAGKPVEVVCSRLIACIHVVEVRSKSTLPRDHRRSTLGWCWYSGAKSWPELLIWAYSPPMGVHRTAIVQGLSSTHGPEVMATLPSAPRCPVANRSGWPGRLATRLGKSSPLLIAPIAEGRPPMGPD